MHADSETMYVLQSGELDLIDNQSSERLSVSCFSSEAIVAQSWVIVLMESQIELKRVAKKVLKGWRVEPVVRELNYVKWSHHQAYEERQRIDCMVE